MCLSAFNYDLETGSAQQNAFFISISTHGNGRPDGACLDSEGNYWSALYQGQRSVWKSSSLKASFRRARAVPATYPQWWRLVDRTLRLFCKHLSRKHKQKKS